MVDIPFTSLSSEALEGVIDDFILREGTDYGSSEVSLERKRTDILSQLKSGRAKVVFEAESESITLVAVAK